MRSLLKFVGLRFAALSAANSARSVLATPLGALASVAIALAVLPAPANAAKKNVDTLPETTIQDLHYGDVLFYFYQDDDFEAITRLNAYEQWGLLSHHHDESQLLLGGLYLSLGLHNEAGKRF